MGSAVRILLKLLALACLLAFLAALVMAAPSYYRQYRILKTWPVVPAVVASRGITPYADDRGGSLYAALVAFSYRVNGRDYLGLYQFPHLSTHYERKQKQLARYVPGSVHSIRYNPADPSDIRVHAGYNVDYFVIPVFMTGVGLIFAVLAGALFFISRLGQRGQISAT